MTIKKSRVLSGCPRCGAAWTKRSGLLRCSGERCGYAPETSHAPWQVRYDDRPYDWTTGHVERTGDPAARAETLSPHPRGRRNQSLTLRGGGR